jgi:hypothetical protein
MHTANPSNPNAPSQKQPSEKQLLSSWSARGKNIQSHKDPECPPPVQWEVALTAQHAAVIQTEQLKGPKEVWIHFLFRPARAGMVTCGSCKII